MFRTAARRIVALTLAVTLAMGASACLPARPSALTDLPTATLSGPRILVIAPHPDDETVGTGAAIAAARARGWRVTVVFVTCGDGFVAAVRRRTIPIPDPAQMQAYGARRAEEALRATAALGVARQDVIFLGFPDSSTHFLWGTNFSGPALLGRNGARAVPYSFAYRPHAPYTGTELESELEQIFARVKPTTILVPDAADIHRDHWASAAFAETALLQSGYRGLVLTYLVHRAGFPNPADSGAGAALSPPASLLHADAVWFSLPITDAERAAQNRALSAYSSQLKADGPLVRSLVRDNALLGMDRAASLGTGTVLLSEGRPDPGFKGARPAASMRAIIVSRSESSTAVELSTAATVSPTVTYALHVRSFGPGRAMRFYDAQIAGGRFSAVRPAAESVAEKGSLEAFRGRGVDVRLPDSLLSGAQWLFIGADTYAGQLTADHAPWRLVRLLPL